MFKNNNQSGAVSLFIVVFTALLITVLTVSFVRLMLRDQQQATTTDLSQSAYDSALAGVEDAKRALLRYQNACLSGDQAECDQLRDDFGYTDADRTCDTLAKAGIAGSVGDPEVKIQQTVGDEKLDQSYTCVKIQFDTDDYIGELRTEESRLIPLRGTAAFDTIEISWFNYQDLPAGDPDRSITLTNDPTDLPVPAGWSNRTPALMRAQLIQFGDDFRLGDFDPESVDEGNAKTLYLYPVGVGIDTVEFDSIGRLSNTADASGVECRNDISTGGYACDRIKLELPDPVGGGARTAYLRLSAHYNASHFSIRLFNGANPVQFDGVQPSVDSTGRANDLFRRVESRVELQDTSFPFPESAVDINGNLCKNFIITDDAADYSSACNP